MKKEKMESEREKFVRINKEISELMKQCERMLENFKYVKDVFYTAEKTDWGEVLNNLIKTKKVNEIVEHLERTLEDFKYVKDVLYTAKKTDWGEVLNNLVETKNNNKWS